MIIVVSDTSPARALANLGRLDLLREIFTEVVVPTAVARELGSPPKGQTVVNLEGHPFIRVQAASDRAAVERSLLDLDAGESEALALALEVRAELILIDEADGRDVANKAGLTSIGVLGILLEAKRRGLVDSLSPLLDQ